MPQRVSPNLFVSFFSNQDKLSGLNQKETKAPPNLADYAAEVRGHF